MGSAETAGCRMDDAQDSKQEILDYPSPDAAKGEPILKKGFRFSCGLNAKRLHTLALLVAIVALTKPCTRMAFGQSAPPRAPVRPVTDMLHGVAVTDPYRWMEDGGQELTDWMKAQDAYARAVLERIPGRQKLMADLRELTTDAEAVTQARRAGGRYAYLKRLAGEQVGKLYVRGAATAVERLLVDQGTLGDGTARFTIGEYAMSPEGRHIAFNAAPGGSGIGNVRIIEVATGRSLPDLIGRVIYINSWRPDGRAFTYTRQRDLPANAPPRDLDLCPTTYLRVLGADPAADRPLIGCGISPRIGMTENQWGGVSFSIGSSYALAWVALNPAATTMEFYTAPVDALAGSETPWVRLAGAEDQIAEAVLRGDTAYLVTGRNAPRRQVVRTPVLHPDLARAEVIVPQSDAVIAPPFALTIASALYLAKDALYVRLQAAGLSRVVRVPFDGSGRTVVPLPYSGAINDLSADPGEPGLLFALESWMRAPRFYTFDPGAGAVRDLRLTPPHPAERPGFEVTEVKVRSAGGTLVPLTIIGRVGLKKDGAHPTRVQGYGAYGITPEPTFRPSIIPWLERGGIDAICHPRGGGDYGEEWHRAGQKENKLNTISDFVACAEYLVTEGYTTHARLAGLGASAGGLAIGGAMTRRPDLFAAVLPSVPLSDLLRFEFGRNGPPNIPEFGTVKDPNDFKAMLAVSPYEHITAGTRYPAVLAGTSINDTSMPPWQAAKLVARLQAATASGKPVLLRVEWGGGHLGGTTTSDREAQLADSYSFMLWQMGVVGFQPPQVTGDERGGHGHR